MKTDALQKVTSGQFYPALNTEARAELDELLATVAKLTAENAALRAALGEYANPANWRFDDENQRNIWFGDYAGPEQAKAALK